MHRILANNICSHSTGTTSQPKVIQNDIYQSEKQVDSHRKSDIQRGKYLKLGNKNIILIENAKNVKYLLNK